jgi:hypothetical protein
VISHLPTPDPEVLEQILGVLVVLTPEGEILSGSRGAVREPLLILDGELRVENANRAYFNTLPVGPQDTHGQPLGALGSGQWEGPALRPALDEVVARERAREGFSRRSAP